MDKNTYFNSVEEMLSRGPYLQIDKDPLNKFISSTSETIKECTHLLNKETVRKIYLSNPTIPKLNCLQKIHKECNEMRPIVSSINSPTYLISKWLDEKFQTFPWNNVCSIKDRNDFINLPKDLIIEKDEYLVSFDIISLYPNVPMKEALNVVKDWLQTLDIELDEVSEFSISTNSCMSQTVYLISK